MKRLVVTCALLACGFVHAFEIVIDRGIDTLTPIAVVPFRIYENAVDITPIINADLSSSGQFRPIDEAIMLSLPSSATEVAYQDWRVQAVEYVIVGSVFIDGLGLLVAEFEVIDINDERVLQAAQVKGSQDDPRALAHHVSDEIFRAITNLPGAFSTQVAYVLVENRNQIDERFTLKISDFDGGREVDLIVSQQPILSPAWAPDGRQLAYVSFAEGGSTIYLLSLDTGQIEKLASFEGINSAPAFSPDGSQVAMVLSRDGNPDIYTIELATNVIRRITDHRAIDTEPVWELNSKSLLFTSDRGGSPQIYRVDVDSLRVSRLTFDGSYNARPRVMPDSEHFIFVHRSPRGFHIAWRDLAGNRAPRILSSNVLDESPSVAPNGVMMMYSTKTDGKGILSIVSVSGEVEYKLTSSLGDMLEPAWSPYLPLTTTLVER
ncbi:MAG: Tol-Pal system beta propeller repeat protein TolB [Gammaproteobacteria bacterium]|nr:Tol-Pal system beta propeller repeat protein TolB [Gammaproteobacteria bacterium]